jgi:cell division protein FtsB
VSARAQAAARRPRARLTGRAVVLAAIVIALLVASVGVVRQYFDQRADIDRLEARLEALLERREALERRIEQLRDPQYLERLARECLGMVAPGEIAFVVPEDRGAPPSTC